MMRALHLTVRFSGLTCWIVSVNFLPVRSLQWRFAQLPIFGAYFSVNRVSRPNYFHSTCKNIDALSKNDANDALGICEMALRPGIHIVAVKTIEQQDIKSL
ncbi:TPA: hypothetical protein ACHICU_005015 [Escherichia coli]|nr:hypothetical protein [Escherichia coli]EER6552333.1 hypothetical protein [Escherichia coli]EET9655937.1 hypothetical protein [Escherichia coli]EEY2070896.1 hypothetical protein [Escherichia coli]EEY7371346.1 hypothetical protein [Escherichia coli]EEY8344699.1 hypothetical protein [Escherichia coli]